MKKFYVVFCLLVVAMMANAEYAGPGFYRVHNAGSDSYISIKGTSFIWSPDPDAFWTCIKMMPAADQAHVSDAGSLIYIPGLVQTSLYAQGVDTYSLTELYMDVDTAKVIEGGLPTYVATTQVWVTLNGTERLMTCYFRDQGSGLTAGFSDKKEARWWIEPVNEESIETSYFGVQPVNENVKDADGMYWTSLCCDFPFLIPAEGGVEGAYAVHQVQQDIDGSCYASVIKVYGQGEVVPAATPVLLKCATPTAAGNKLIPTGEIANNRSFPLVNGMLRGNYFSSYINHMSINVLETDLMCEYVPEQATPATAENLELGVDAEGRLGFYPKTDGEYMDANTAWLSIENLDKEGVTSVYLYEIVLGDTNGDGVTTIKDVTYLIDYLLGSNDTRGIGNTLCADVDGNGKITIKDVTALIDMLLGSSAQ